MLVNCRLQGGRLRRWAFVPTLANHERVRIFGADNGTVFDNADFLYEPWFFLNRIRESRGWVTCMATAFVVVTVMFPAT
ncbi:MAG: hypothetical protein GY758_23815 [Fuerstiella sp.]|nr:hypothetical protein [Fuerstiella sp.]MCP4512718.1 hypothetical protein [Fuerstiella sp.]